MKTTNPGKAEGSLGAALRHAGVLPPGEALDAIADRVLAEAQNDFDLAMERLAAEVSPEPALLWALFEPWRDRALQELLARRAQVARDRKAGDQRATTTNTSDQTGHGAANPEAQGEPRRPAAETSARSSPSLNMSPPPPSSEPRPGRQAAADGAGDQRCRDTHGVGVSRPNPSKRTPDVIAADLRQRWTLDTVTELGRFGDLRHEQLKALSLRNRIDGWVINMAVAVTAHNPTLRLRDMQTPEEIAAWDRRSLFANSSAVPEQEKTA